MSAKLAANEIRTHACTNQKRTLDRGRGNPFNNELMNKAIKCKTLLEVQSGTSPDKRASMHSALV